MSRAIDFRHIHTFDELSRFCQDAADARLIGFDTEFVSEDRYVPELCLLQIVADERLAIVDTLEVTDLGPFWDLITTSHPDRTVVVHAAREEFRFCKNACGQRPFGLVDTQIMAGLVGLEFPASYATLVQRFCGETLSKNETRTNWLRRPLNDAQLQYAIKDVAYLRKIHDSLKAELESLNRLSWLDEEMQRLLTGFESASDDERWMKLGGLASMKPDQLAIARALWQWRESVALETNQPPRRILRDDLLVELARRKCGKLSGIRSIRGMEYGRVKKHLNAIADTIDAALEMDPSDFPKRSRKSRVPNLGLLGQFLATSVGIVCREEQVSPNLVFSTEELRSFAAWRLGILKLDEPPRLYSGWRKDLIGDRIDEVLDGTTMLRVVDPLSDTPLEVVRRKKDG